MAENLLAWPPYRVKDVVKIQNNIFAYGKNISDTAIWEGTLKDLESMATILEEQEKKFYNAIGVSSLQELQKELDEVNKDPGFRAMTSGEVIEIGTNPSVTNSDLVKNGISWGEIGDTFAMLFDDNNDLEKLLRELEIDQDISNSFVGALQQVLPEGKTRINKSHSATQARGFKRRFGDLTIYRDPKTGKVRAKVTLLEKLSNSWKNRLQRDYDILFDGLPTQAELIWRWLDKNIANAELKDYVKDQFDRNLDKYAISRSKAGVLGFLGEVKANAFFCFLRKDKNATIPTGVELNSNDKEVPIDALVQNFGFQIKNYRFDNGEVTFNYKQGADSFVESRMAADQPLADMLIAFFGSYTYNKPVAGADEYESQVYERFRKALNGENDRIVDILDLYLDNILKISSYFKSKSKDGPFKDEKRWYNTFFLIGSTFVPSSAIVWAIREELERNASGRSYLRSSYKFTDTDSTKVDIENNDLSEQGLTTLPVWPGVGKYIPGDMRKTANRVKIEANVTLNIPQILSNAAERARIKSGQF